LVARNPKVRTAPLKIDEIGAVNFLDSSLKVAKKRFSEISSRQKCRNVKSENFMRGQEREEEFLKGNVGEQIRLHFRDKHSR